MDRNTNVLIVDDYRTMLRIIRNLLKQLDFNNVDEATDGQEALAKLRAGNFGLVISDWNMAPMTGLDLLKEVRADARLKNLPFIMITAERWLPMEPTGQPSSTVTQRLVFFTELITVS